MRRHLQYGFSDIIVNKPREVVEIPSKARKLQYQTIRKILDFYIPSEERNNWKVEAFPSFPIIGENNPMIWDCLNSVYKSEVRHITSVNSEQNIIDLFVRSKRGMFVFVGKGGTKVNEFKEKLQENGLDISYVNVLVRKPK